ncbi:MAG: gliding motility-associated peptidyl-prolyl isomerase GldI [Flavobacteriaceae bacterium]|nr:gliding motility-associated peptidyl-prolyl isomerase GldI [Flavobacteriaceae bacterium]
MRINFFYFVALSVLLSCSSTEARRPLSPKPSTIISETVAQSKKLNELENKIIAQWIALDSMRTYQSSSKGYWYAYLKKIDTELPFPEKGDVVTFNYVIQDLNGTIIYDETELGIKKYAIDEEDFIPALQDGLKLMKVGETIIFVIPSYSAYGIGGDGNKIGINQSIKCTLTLLNINKE